MAGSATRACIAAASVGAVKALKDQVICRWNNTMRTIHHHHKDNLRSYAHAKKLSSSSAMAARFKDQDKVEKFEESLRKVMYLSCWGPN